MGKFGGILKRIKDFFNKDDKNKYLIYNDPNLIDPGRKFREMLETKIPDDFIRQKYDGQPMFSM